jgi:type I restriction enzyme M protein
LYRDDFFVEPPASVALSRPSGEGGTGEALVYFACPSAPFLLATAAQDGSPEPSRSLAFQYALSTETIGTVVFLAGAGDTLNVFRRRFSENEFEVVPGLEHYHKQATVPNSDERTPKTWRLENVFFEMHSIMRDTDGLHADAALEELCKLIYLKSFMEKHGSLLPFPAVNSSVFGTNEEFAACLRSLYREASNHDLRAFRLKIPEYEKSRGIFGSPFYLSTAALTKSFRAIENYSLSEADTDVKGRAFQRVLTKSVRAGMGQYFTPSQVCKLMVEIVAPKTSDLIIDPFCGSGHFLTLSLAHVRAQNNTNTRAYHEFAFGKLHGIEKSDRMTRIAMTDMLLNGDGHSNIRCTDALLDFRNYSDLKPASFNAVMTNPPFGSLLGAESLQGLASFDLAANRKNVPLEVLGLERAVELLRPDGKLAIVLPESIFSADSCRYVREWLQKRVAIRIIIDLPAETFSPYGANVRSGLLFGRKRHEGEHADPDASVCMIRLDNLGYDASGRIRDGAEQDQAAMVAKRFLKRHGW